ncbi:MAG: hypothetical protein HY722_05395 [Planctomycetes bacterium]|nr:hypothetical protein [Planctomycetota bacterium]
MRLLRAAWVPVLALAAGCAAGPPVRDPDIAGAVYELGPHPVYPDRELTLPLQGVDVRACAVAGPEAPLAAGRTDYAGGFALGRVPGFRTGTRVRLEFRKEGYEPQDWELAFERPAAHRAYRVILRRREAPGPPGE